MLQNALNPPEKYKREYRFKDILYREGDKVMQTRNNYDMRWDKNGSGGCGIFNGDIGVIHQINISEKYMEIYFDERVVSYEFSFLDDLELAYAITVHKSQGSEYPTVIIPIGSSAPRLLTRHLLYTAVTRAQERVILVGRVDLLEYMVKNDRQSMRYTGLLERLRK
jgi:exodeoxyribonuclease V alpha subunit